jgi:hypothetical protein
MPFKNSISVFTKFTQKQKKKRGRKGHEWRGERGVRTDSNPSRLKSVKTPICLPGHEKERGK